MPDTIQQQLLAYHHPQTTLIVVKIICAFALAARAFMQIFLYVFSMACATLLPIKGTIWQLKSGKGYVPANCRASTVTLSNPERVSVPVYRVDRGSGAKMDPF